MSSRSVFGIRGRDAAPAEPWLSEIAADTSEDDRRDAELLAYAHRQAARWGAGRFALELRRRDEEDRRQRAARRWTPERRVVDRPETAVAAATQGPVLADVSDQVVASSCDPEPVLDLAPAIRHPEVPRPPVSVPRVEPRGRMRRRRPRATPTPSPNIAERQAAGMSPGARRLYGIPDPPNRRGT